MTLPALLDADVEHFVAEGWLLTRSHDDVDAVVAWVDEVSSWPDDGPWLHHRELTDDGPQLCRTENFVPFHEGLATLLTTGPMLQTASALLGEPAVLYKEKINYMASLSSPSAMARGSAPSNRPSIWASVRSGTKPKSVSPSTGAGRGLPITAVPTTTPSVSNATSVRLRFGSLTTRGCSTR
jgi:hypothetical protein